MSGRRCEYRVSVRPSLVTASYCKRRQSSQTHFNTDTTLAHTHVLSFSGERSILPVSHGLCGSRTVQRNSSKCKAYLVVPRSRSQQTPADWPCCLPRYTGRYILPGNRRRQLAQPHCLIRRAALPLDHHSKAAQTSLTLHNSSLTMEAYTVDALLAMLPPSPLTFRRRSVCIQE